MAFGKNSIMDSRRPSSSPWSTLTTFLFICICLLGVWMISTTVVPVDVPSIENNLAIKHEVFETNLGNGEGSWRDVPDEPLRRDSNGNANNFPPETNPESSENQNVPDKTDESTVEKVQNGDMNDGNSSQTTFSDEDGTTGEGGEVIKEGSGERKEDGKENDQEIVEEISQETTDREQEKKAETFSDENGNTEGAEMSKEGDVSKVGGDENIQEKSTDESSQETTEKNSDDAGDGNDKTQGLEEISQETTEKSSDDAGDGNGKTEGGEESSQETTEKSSDDAGDGNGKTQGGEESSQEITEKSSDDGVDGNSKTQGGEESSQEITEKSSDDVVDGNDKTQGGEESSEETTDSSDDVGDGNGKTQGGEESSQETTEKSSDDASDGNGKTQGGEVNSQETTEDSSNDASDGNAKTQGGEESSLETTEKSSDDSSDENVKTQGGEVGSQETKYSDQEKKGDRKNNETTGDEQDKSSDQQNPDDSMVKPEQKLDENAVMGNQTNDQVYDEVLPDAAQSELLNETNTQNGAWSTQATESKNEKEVQAASKDIRTHNWKLCNVSTGVDYIPCLDNVEAIKKLTTRQHYEHRERHCPDEGPTCLVPNPEGYRKSIEWPNSRNKIWYYNVPHSQLASVKGRQNWVRVSGEYLTFPGGGTQFKHGALHYIDFIQQSVPDIAWGKKSRVALDVGCGVASFGGYLFNRNVLTMSFAPKDEHEAQVQLALERGIPAISAVMGTIRLPFPGMVFDVIHCARCKVPWHIEGGVLLLELNRLLRPGGYFIWSATPTYQKLSRDVEIWRAMGKLTKSMCWEMVNKTKDRLNKVGMAIYRKPTNNECYVTRTESAPPLCEDSDDPNAAWNISLQACMHRLPEDPAVRGSKWPQVWPQRLTATPYWLNSSQVGVYGKPAPEDFKVDFKHWKRVVSNSYLNGMGIKWSSVRNIMDMRAVYGGFAAALQEAKKVNAWVMNVVSIDAPDTLRVIYERGLFGIYHNWCESFSTYPRSFDLLHADHLFSKLKQRCKLLPVMAEVDRILRPNGYFILRDDVETLEEVESMARSLNYKIIMTFSKENEGLLCVEKTMWRPKEIESSLPTNAKLSN